MDLAEQRADELIDVPGKEVDKQLVKEVWKAGYNQALKDLEFYDELDERIDELEERVVNFLRKLKK